MIREMMEGIKIAGLSFFAILVLILFPLLSFGPDLEPRSAPVVQDVVVASVDRRFVPKDVLEQSTINAEWYKFTFNKMRACKPFTELFKWYVVHKDDTKERVNIYTFWSKNEEIGDRVVYVQVDQISSIPFDSQILVVAHDCHPLWLSRTRINIPISSDDVKKRQNELSNSL